MRLVVAVLTAVAMSACSAPPADTVTVFAASSLSGAFEDLAGRFERDHPGLDVVLNLAGSQTLASQIVNGAQPDVFASADQRQMDRALQVAPADVGPFEFATNRLSIVVGAGNPKQIESLADLGKKDVAVVLGAEEVPVGRYAREALNAAGVEVEAASYELDTGLVLTKVALGEADAGLVYHSDVARAGGDVVEVPIPTRFNVEAVYPIAGWNLAGSSLATEFIDFAMSPEGRDALLDAGLGT